MRGPSQSLSPTAWGLFPLVFAAAGLGLREVAFLAALYPGV